MTSRRKKYGTLQVLLLRSRESSWSRRMSDGIGEEDGVKSDSEDMDAYEIKSE